MKMTDKSTYDHLQPTSEQLKKMERVRAAAKAFGDVLAVELPDGPDKAWVIRLHRTTAMWSNVAVTRQADGKPRTD